MGVAQTPVIRISMDGFLNLLKPPGMTSSDAVVWVRRLLLGEKVGHAGTLDPEACGVLPIMIGSAARLFDYVVDKEKTYIAEFVPGSATDTQDAQGRVTATSQSRPTREEVEAALPRFVGDIRQVPPAYSAIKQGGRKAYEMARAGETVSLEARMVTIHSLRLLPHETRFMLAVSCGKGTYMRTLCHDLGEALGCHGHMRFLLRTQSGVFTLEQAVTPEEFEQAHAQGQAQALLIPMDVPIAHLPRVDVHADAAKQCLNGNPLPRTHLLAPQAQGEGPVRLYLDCQLAGIGVWRDDRIYFRAMLRQTSSCNVATHQGEKR